MAVSKVTTIEEAMSHVKDGDRIMVGGFGLRGCPDDLLSAMTLAHQISVLAACLRKTALKLLSEHSITGTMT